MPPMGRTACVALDMVFSLWQHAMLARPTENGQKQPSAISVFERFKMKFDWHGGEISGATEIDADYKNTQKMFGVSCLASVAQISSLTVMSWHG